MAQKSQQRMQCEEITSTFSTNHPCAQWFGAIERSVVELSRQVENVALDVKDLTEKVIGQEKLMALIREEFLPQIRKIPETIEKEIHKHKKDCLASTKAMKKAEENGNHMEVRTSRAPGSKGFSIPKVVIYIGVIIGTAIAIGGYVLAYLFDKLQ